MTRHVLAGFSRIPEAQVAELPFYTPKCNIAHILRGYMLQPSAFKSVFATLDMVDSGEIARHLTGEQNRNAVS